MNYIAYMEFKRLSIKNFIGDLPNIINENFDKVFSFINSIFNEETRVLHVKGANIDTKINANSLIANNIIVNDGNGNKISFAEILEKLERLEQNTADEAI